MKTKQFILMIAAVFLFLSTNSQNAYSQLVDKSAWDNNSDELPGMMGSEVFLIAGGVIVTGLIIYLIARKGKDDKSSSYSIGEPGYILAKAPSRENGPLYSKMENASQNSAVEIFTFSEGYLIENKKLYRVLSKIYFSCLSNSLT